MMAFNPERLDTFLYWIRERWQILRKRRAGLPWPWTTDPILRDCYFTNVRREDDKTTVWCRENVREPLQDDPLVLPAVVTFRWFNYIPTGKVLLGNSLLTYWSSRRALRVLGSLEGQVFTGAFNISNGGSKRPKLEQVCHGYLDPFWADWPNLRAKVAGWTSLAQAHKDLTKYPGLGGSGFMAAQVVADVKHTPLLAKATDWHTWCSPGPGSIRGLNLLLGRPVGGPAPADFTGYVGRLRQKVHDRPGLPLDAQDLQNCLCEFSKYCKVLTGGHSKRRYHHDH